MKQLLFLFATVGLMIACNSNSDKKDTNDTTTTTHHADDINPAGDTVNGTAVNDIDQEFALKAGMGNTAEVEAGQLAENKGDNKEVRDFGAMMVKDHGEAQGKLKAIAGSLSVSAPDSVDQEHKDLKTKLSDLSGKAFDKAYIDAQLKDHRATIALFEKEINGGSNTQLKEFATSTLPHIKMHLEKAEKLQAGTN